MKLWYPVNHRLAEDPFHLNELKVLQLQSSRNDECCRDGRKMRHLAVPIIPRTINDTFLLDVRTLDTRIIK